MLARLADTCRVAVWHIPCKTMPTRFSIGRPSSEWKNVSLQDWWLVFALQRGLTDVIARHVAKCCPVGAPTAIVTKIQATRRSSLSG